jgi:lipid-A-disaccharide synthase-like uncharacterized protein
MKIPCTFTAASLTLRLGRVPGGHFFYVIRFLVFLLARAAPERWCLPVVAAFVCSFRAHQPSLGGSVLVLQQGSPVLPHVINLLLSGEVQLSGKFDERWSQLLEM